MNRRTLLNVSAAALASIAIPSSGRIRILAQDTAAFPELIVTLTDDGFSVPEGTTSGRYAVSVVNESSMPSHSSLGLLPKGVDLAMVEEVMASDSEDVPQWILDTKWVGLPDWGFPGETRTGIVDLPPGTYLGFSASESWFNIIEIGGEPIPGDTPEPEATLSVELIEMAFTWGQDAVPSGPQRLRVLNAGTTLHDIQFYPVPDGTTTDHAMEMFMLDEGGTPAPENPMSAMSEDEFVPAAATSIIAPGVTSWLDIDLAPGTYLVMCPLPFPSG
ncbi:MAG: hypothetical protein KC438_09420, partial [Thermomicrobiales bacterium]|nr:hypothetical protein [Thermomicrobiales bacterium]